MLTTPACRLFAILLLAGAMAPAVAEKSASFARIQSGDDGRPQALQMAIVTYVPAKDPDRYSVDLISAIHVGDSSYYADLNRRFRTYDVLLYELIISSERDVPEPAGERRGLISNTQLAIKDALGLSFQLDEIDYGRPNFVHADLTSDELSQSMEERDESLYVYFWRVFYASMDQYAKDPLGLNSWSVLASLWTADSGNSLKVAFAQEMVGSNFSEDILEGNNGSAIIDSRNERAVAVLRQQLESGATRIGIFYGVAHMRDFEERLLRDIGLVRKSETWIDAWDLSPD